MLNVTQRLWLPNSNIDIRLNLNFLITFTRNSNVYLHKYTHAIGPIYHSKQLIQTAAAGATHWRHLRTTKSKEFCPSYNPTLLNPKAFISFGR